MEFKNWLNESEEPYKGEHEAPDKGSGSPAYNLTDVMPDVYGPDALRMCSSGFPTDNQAIQLIKAVYKKPNVSLRVYRAVPKILSQEEQILDYENQLRYILKHGKMPPKAKTKLTNSNQYYNWVYEEINRLRTLPPQNDFKKMTINPGDWVTITRAYAVEHGIDHLRNDYKIITKLIKSKYLFSDGNSVQEFGYDPS